MKGKYLVDLSPINTLSICSGVGGLDLGLELATNGAARPVCFIEREAFPAAILAKRMEEKAVAAAPIWSDLRTFDGKPWRGVVDCVTGGYPCQPFSSAGKRLGEDHPRHLWPEIRRITKDIEPRFVFFENVAGHLTLGLADVLRDLQEMGFRCSTGLFTAEEVGAPHRRERLFILGMADRDSRMSGSESFDGRAEGIEKESDDHGCGPKLADSMPNRSQGIDEIRTSTRTVERSDGSEIPDFPPGPKDFDAWKRILEHDEKLAPAIESGIHGMDDRMASRVDRLRACGNGVVPLVAAYAFTTLLACIGE